MASYCQPLTAVDVKHFNINVENTIISVYDIVCNSSVYIENVVTASQIKCDQIKQPGETLGFEEICLLLPNYQQLPAALTYIC